MSSVKPDERIRQARTTVDQLQRTLGPAHPESLKAMRELSDRYVERGELSEARDTLLRLAEVKRRQTGDIVDFEMLSTTYQLGYALYRLGDLPWARKVQEQVLNWSIHLYGMGSTNAIRSLRNLDVTLLEMGDKAAFLAAGDDIVNAVITSSGRPPVEDLEFLYSLAQMYRCNGYPDTGSKLYKRVLMGCIRNVRRPSIFFRALIFELLFIPAGLWALRRNPELVRSMSTSPSSSRKLMR
jgi:hypothetical protein